MAISTLPLLILSLLAVTASARPCKTLFYFSAATTAAYYPFNSLPRNPDPNSLIENQNPRYFTLIFSSTTTTTNPFSDRRSSMNFDTDSVSAFEDNPQSSPKTTSSDFPLKFYSSVSRSIRERTKDIMSVVSALLFGIGCGALTSVVMYLVWTLFFPSRFYFNDDDDEDDIASAKTKLGYLAVPTKPEVVEHDIKKPAPPSKEVV